MPLYPTDVSPYPRSDSVAHKPIKQIKGAPQIDFSKPAVIDEIAKEYSLLHSEPINVLVLGQTESGKDGVVDAILSAFDLKRSNMIRSVTNTEEAIFDEMSTGNMSPLKMKYLPVVKDKVAFDELASFRESQTTNNGDTTGWDPYSGHLSSKQEEEMELMAVFHRLSKLTAESFNDVYIDSDTVYPLLFTGFMRRIQGSEAMRKVTIPAAIVVLIKSFYVLIKPQSEKLTIKSFKFQTKSQSKVNVLQPPGMDISYWSTADDWYSLQDRAVIDGILFVVDLATYDESFEDENGRKKNKLEHALSIWNSIQYSGSISRGPSVPKMAIFTEPEQFREKLATNPLSVCPLFPHSVPSGKGNESEIEEIRSHFRSGIVVDIKNREEIVDNICGQFQWLNQ